VLLDEVQLGGVLLFRHQGFPRLGLLPDLLRKFIVPLQFRLNCLNGCGAFVPAPDNGLLIVHHTYTSSA